jgi:competence protein ComFC
MFPKLLSFFFPFPCLSCQKLDSYSNQFGICISCIRAQRKIQRNAHANQVLCSICSQIQTEETSGPCEFCSSRFIFFSQVVSLRIRNGWERKMLQSCKFQNEKILGNYFALDFFAKAKSLDSIPDLIVLLPSQDKESGRDFHPADRLAKRIAKKWNITIQRGLKKVSKEKQSGKRYSERFSHAKKAFQIIKKDRIWDGLHILIIDDIFTTGASINEASRMILSAGASRVSCMVLLSNEGD